MGALLVLNVYSLMTNLLGKYIAEVISNLSLNNYKLQKQTTKIPNLGHTVGRVVTQINDDMEKDAEHLDKLSSVEFGL